jgi:hypothetical protein
MKTLRFVKRFIRERLSDMCARHEGTGIVVDTVDVEEEDNLHLLYECIINSVIMYIKRGRAKGEGKMSRLEQRYMFTPGFYIADDPRKYLEEHRETNDHGLIMFCLENYEQMEYASHRLQIMCTLVAINNFRNMF